MLEGFTDTNWIPGAQNRIPLEASAEPRADGCAGLRALIRRNWLTRPCRTPTSRRWCCAKFGSSRIAYFPGDIERTYWLTGHGDLLRLMHNTIRGSRTTSTSSYSWRRLCRDVCLGDDAGYRGPRAELHQPERAPRLAARKLSDWAADRPHATTAGCWSEIC